MFLWPWQSQAALGILSAQHHSMFRITHTTVIQDNCLGSVCVVMDWLQEFWGVLHRKSAPARREEERSWNEKAALGATLLVLGFSRRNSRNSGVCLEQLSDLSSHDLGHAKRNSRSDSPRGLWNLWEATQRSLMSAQTLRAGFFCFSKIVFSITSLSLRPAFACLGHSNLKCL